MKPYAPHANKQEANQDILDLIPLDKRYEAINAIARFETAVRTIALINAGERLARLVQDE